MLTGRRDFRDEIRASARLALPVAGVQLGFMLMGTVDTAMLGHFSAEALAAGAIGNVLSYTLLLLASGTLAALDPLMTQAHGAGDWPAMNGHLQRGLVLAAALTVPVSLGMLDISPLLKLLGEPPGVAVSAAAYTRYLIWGNLPLLLYTVLRQGLQAMSVVRPALAATVFGNVVNALANYALVFGHWGAPRLGVVGSACATSLSRWMTFAWLLLAGRRALSVFWRGFTAEAFAVRRQLRLLRIGLPIGLHQSIELSFFLAIALLMGRLGTIALAGHQIAINLASLSFMVPLGISGAATTRVGNAIGRGDMAAARRAAVACLGLGAGVMTLFAAAFALAPRFLSGLYTHEAAVIAVASTLLPIAAAFQVFDGTQVVGAGVLRGVADTTLPAASALLGFLLIGLPAGWGLAFAAGWGARGLWWGITLGIAVVATLLVARIAFRLRRHVTRVAG